MTVGPVSMHQRILKISGEQPPYFRTNEFSDIMRENESGFLKMIDAPDDSRCVFLTTSGTGGMESCVSNFLTENDRVVIINGGTFGQRFVDLCVLYSIPYIEVKCDFGKQIDREKLEEIKDENISTLLVNMDETSSGLLYDMDMISDFCRKKSIFLIVDVISSLLADRLSMKSMGANVLIAASQKALALQPGLAVVAMDNVALKRLDSCKVRNMYLNLTDALKNMERGQTPFTPAVSILLQMNERLKMIEENGGPISEVEKTRMLAENFRKRIIGYPFELLIDTEKDRSNAVTAIVSLDKKARLINDVLKEKYGIWICPNGGIYSDSVFRVGHIGNLSIRDNDKLFEAFKEMKNEGII
jgi:aspartate aminotransferase-like enzyme